MKKIRRVRVVHDQDPGNPRKEFDNLGTMVCWHRRYILGDEQPAESPTEYQERLPEGTLILPLYLYDHSGITMNTTGFHCPWDSGQVGFIYITPEKIRKEYGENPDLEAIKGYLQSEVELYDQYLRGAVYGFVIEAAEIEDDPEFMDEDEDLEWEQEDSCFGFYGSDPFKNGMAEHVDEELHDKLREAAEKPEYA